MTNLNQNLFSNTRKSRDTPLQYGTDIQTKDILMCVTHLEYKL